MKRSVSLFVALILSSIIEQLWAKAYDVFLMLKALFILKNNQLVYTHHLNAIACQL
ncbi:hypothetical protein [Pedobacter chitinilyticus]|uniref:hypothetical protein n=1 Tax=Pedobacter chitinilyticus TaxID=2233776 RepID=UPI0019699C05|nr:hypothetical protein [Pedobacter chitinilyticus]